MVALLRAVNVGGRKLPMARLRALCEELGWKDVTTYIQSGNVVFAAAAAVELERELEHAIARRFRLDVPVMVRTATQWRGYPAANPFPGAAREEPNRLMLLLSKEPPAADAAARLQQRAADGERVSAGPDALWIHFAGGSARSKLTPSLIDRTVGSPTTARNYRTVTKLQEMLSA
ncbi:MAG: DUF1697 domain-containing protein [Pseudomonadota bacterium]|nr:DUF1697 domain-containing protein [Pseudomonadota bacterium]